MDTIVSRRVKSEALAECDEIESGGEGGDRHKDEPADDPNHIHAPLEVPVVGNVGETVRTEAALVNEVAVTGGRVH